MKRATLLLLFSFSCEGVWGTQKLITIIPSPNNIDCCSSLASCQAEVNSPAFLSQSSVMMPCTHSLFHFNRTISDTTHYYVTSIGETATITRNHTSMFGSVSLQDLSFVLDYKNSAQMWVVETDSVYESDNSGDMADLPQSHDKVKHVDYSLLVYITPEVQREVEDIRAWVDERLEEMNDAYRNSGIPLSVTLHCIQLAKPGVDESLWYKEVVLWKFRNMNGIEPALLRQSADAAILVMNRMQGCGRAILGGIADGETFGVVRRDCAENKLTIPHEIGHSYAKW